MRMSPHQPLFTIGTVSKLLQLHEQTIRQYERLGLLCPSRTARKTRMYCQTDIERLECITYLVKNCGVNLAGVKLLVQFSISRPEIENFLKAQTRMKDIVSMSRNLLPASTEEIHDIKIEPPTTARKARRKK